MARARERGKKSSYFADKKEINERRLRAVAMEGSPALPAAPQAQSPQCRAEYIQR